MIRPGLILLLCTGFIAGLVLFVPMSVVLRLSGAEAAGLSWTHASGTLAGGNIRNLSLSGRPVGNVVLSFRPSALLSLSIAYDAVWRGTEGSGTGRIEAGPGNRLILKDFDLEIQVTGIEGLPDWIRDAGGSARVSGSVLQFDVGACTQAEARASSDILRQHETFFGSGWPDLDGGLRCEDELLIIPLAAKNQNGTLIETRTRLGLTGKPVTEVLISGFIPAEMRLTLGLSGFTETSTGFVYTPPAHNPENQP